MKFIEFNSTKCKHCYKCVRNCPIKAIMVRDERAEIIEDHCVLCGRCLQVCPQSAKTLISEIDTVKAMIDAGDRVVATIAPSYYGIMKFREAGQVVGALTELGFEAVCETSEGAAIVTQEYVRLIREGRMRNIITTCCPSVNDLIEKYHPSLVKYLAPVVSPMIASGKLIKKHMGEDTKVVFIGPCIAKKREARDPRVNGIIDAVISFEDVDKWLAEKNINIEDCPEKSFNVFDPRVNRLYPVTGGVLKSVHATLRGTTIEEMDDDEDEDSGSETATHIDHYRKFYVHGAEDCMELCRDMEEGGVNGCFIEMNMCADGCIKGPLVKENDIYKYKIKLDMGEEIKQEPVPPDELSDASEGISFEKEFVDRSLNDPMPTEEQIQDIMEKVGKHSPEDELNCGACGYPTCRDKAIAVFQGKAELGMCIPYLHQQAESMANVVMEESPNAVIVVDRSMKILEYSKNSEEYFGVPREKALGRNLSEFIDTVNCKAVFRTKEDIHGKKVNYREYKMATLQNIVYMPRQDCVLMTIVNITQQEIQAREEYENRLHNTELAQNVIREQMITAQKIASLLGETTARTKTTMTALCSSIMEEGSDNAGELEGNADSGEHGVMPVSGAGNDEQHEQQDKASPVKVMKLNTQYAPDSDTDDHTTSQGIKIINEIGKTSVSGDISADIPANVEIPAINENRNPANPVKKFKIVDKYAPKSED